MEERVSATASLPPHPSPHSTKLLAVAENTKKLRFEEQLNSKRFNYSKKKILILITEMGRLI